MPTLGTFDLSAEQQAPLAGPPVASFKTTVDLVQVSAIVRDRKGRFVDDLSARDFEVLDGGQSRTIADFRRESTGVSIALLFDASGSMESRIVEAREAAGHILSWLDDRDEAAIFSFDTRLDQVRAFSTGRQALPERLATLTPFGATSLHDAIAKTAESLATREGRRRGVIVLTDGKDNASHLTPSEVSGIASAIDVPVYVVGIVRAIDNPSAQEFTSTLERSPLSGRLADLASWTGGSVFAVSTPAERSQAAQSMLAELRHQYVIAFESNGNPGWHPLVVRTRTKDLNVRARSGYIAGQSRPLSH
jgi:VWFA-related protein